MKTNRPTEPADLPEMVRDWNSTPLFTDADLHEVHAALTAAHDAIVTAAEATGEHPGILKDRCGLAAAWSLFSSMRDFLAWAASPSDIPAHQIAYSAEFSWCPEVESVEAARSAPTVNAIIERRRGFDGINRWTHHPINSEVAA